MIEETRRPQSVKDRSTSEKRVSYFFPQRTGDIMILLDTDVILLGIISLWLRYTLYRQPNTLLTDALGHSVQSSIKYLCKATAEPTKCPTSESNRTRLPVRYQINQINIIMYWQIYVYLLTYYLIFIYFFNFVLLYSTIFGENGQRETV